jgi:hypothetical protein
MAVSVGEVAGSNIKILVDALIVASCRKKPGAGAASDASETAKGKTCARDDQAHRWLHLLAASEMPLGDPLRHQP